MVNPMLRYQSGALHISLMLLLCLGACGESSSQNNLAMSLNPQQHIGPIPSPQADIERYVHDRVFFEFDSAELNALAKHELSYWIGFLNKYPARSLVIEGHCDERGTRDYNLALGYRRAEVVKSFLLANGIASSRLRTKSYGKERPAVLGSNEEAWAQNRRAVGLIM